MRGNVLIYEHKEDHLNEVRRRFAAERYAHIEDKAALLARTKAAFGDRAKTVHVRQGHDASERPSGAQPDIVVERIADLLTIDLARLVA